MAVFYFSGRTIREHFTVTSTTEADLNVDIAKNFFLSGPTLNASPKLDVSTTNANQNFSWSQLKAHFSSPYNSSEQIHSYQREQEISQRLHLLQQVRSNSELRSEEWDFYKFVLFNPQEQWIVQRQVLKNILPRLPKMTESTRDHFFARINKRALASWQLSDRELATILLGENEN